MALTTPPAANVLAESAVTVIVVVADAIGVTAAGLNIKLDFEFFALATAVAQAAVEPVAKAADHAVPPSLEVNAVSTRI